MIRILFPNRANQPTILVANETKYRILFFDGDVWGRCPQTPGVFKALRGPA